MTKPAATLICATPDDLPDIARQVIEAAGAYRLICLSGDLGAGKTALVTAMVAALGSSDAVSSPTFALVQDYLAPTLYPPVIHHIDAYRLNDLQEALDIGLPDYLDDPAWTFVEWPEILDPILPEERLDIHLQILPDSKREIVFLKR